MLWLSDCRKSLSFLRGSATCSVRMGNVLELVVILAVAGVLRCTCVYGQIQTCKYPYSVQWSTSVILYIVWIYKIEKCGCVHFFLWRRLLHYSNRIVLGIPPWRVNWTISMYSTQCQSWTILLISVQEQLGNLALAPNKRVVISHRIK